MLSGQVIAQDLNDDQEFFDTPEAPAQMDNTFMGYTIAVGHFSSDSVPGENYRPEHFEHSCSIDALSIFIHT